MNISKIVVGFNVISCENDLFVKFVKKLYKLDSNLIKSIFKELTDAMCNREVSSSLEAKYINAVRDMCASEDEEVSKKTFMKALKLADDYNLNEMKYYFIKPCCVTVESAESSTFAKDIKVKAKSLTSSTYYKLYKKSFGKPVVFGFND